MKKLQSTFWNMALVLGGVCLVAAALLAWVNELTAEPIRLADLAKQETAIKVVSPLFDNQPVLEKCTVFLSGEDSIVCYPARLKGELVGVAVESYSDNGFNGRISVMVGFRADGSVYNYSVLKQSETPGLGNKMLTWFKTDKNRQSILGKNPAADNISVSKDGGDIDAITAATISSRAFMDAVNRAYRAYCATNYEQVDARSSERLQQTKEETLPADSVIVKP